VSTHRSSLGAGGPRRRRLKQVLLALGITTGVAVVVSFGVALWLNSSLSNIEKFDVTVKERNRPPPDDDDALNILLLGADAGSERNGPGTSIIKDSTLRTWPQGKYRSDATMLMHISDDRHHAFVVSIPRDSYLPVHDSTGQQRDTTKINAALSIYGPSGALSTVENFAGQRVDHLAMIDWDGFMSVTDALGGV
jgi:anionic cell wall polymer biosynthesis LytR-Cps2A-Psr (LCP) family protein